MEQHQGGMAGREGFGGGFGHQDRVSRLHAIELHLLMLAGIAFLCVSGWQVWRVGNEMDATMQVMNKSAGDAGATLAKLNLELDEAHRLTLEAGLTAMEARKASKMELTYLPQWNRQITATIGNVQQTITALQGTAKAATETLHGASLDLEAVNDSIRATKPLIEASTKTVQDYGAIAPYLKQSMVNMQGVTFHFNAIAADAQQVSDKETTDFLKPVKW